MTFIQILTIAIVQGITEFLPISSQAHLILVPRFTGWCDQGLLMDIAVHVGTLGAVMVYFWRECFSMGKGALDIARARKTKEGTLLLCIVLATLPVIAGGYTMKEYLGWDLRSLTVIGWATLGFGVLLWMADRWGLRVRRVEHMTFGTAFIIGCAQVLALIPGTSRSGITMTAARMFGFERSDAARFSMLMAIPVILAAGTLTGLDLAKAGNIQLTRDAIMAGGLAFITALVAIAALMGWLRKSSFAPFVIYRILLGVGLLVAAYGFGFDHLSATQACN
ncbi:MAG: undecaprenyl-diphosphate phosphatase [Rhodospirillales bacterium]|nr:undecaprenyl-diphosphate phosphatase [Rhodospirillales bacterium]MBT4005827.1 undecaprenyl-diphosphate phosphatase [Rhodospirillales bacterium]MBT5075606.1 undecaprenyl-diphosphate phosphatase [Rhodospirillales bacterium]MBT5114112.1 undecaprenyl-diphosphate phosphatase [Rhodospirillales bacterium]MBT5672640.1 undecaprenyl-diphosphate phosphatase [Rhodospirillales bacterium]